VTTIIGHFATLAELNPLEPVTAVPLFTRYGHVIISNHAAMIIAVTVLLLVCIPLGVRSPKLVPRGLQNLVESVCVYLRDEMARPVLGEKTDRFIGLLWTIFFFILTLNLAAMIPTEKIFSLMLGRPCHLGGPATANIFVTGAMAVMAFVLSNVYGIRQHGFLHYLAHLAPPAPKWLLPLIYPLELLSIFIRPFTLAIRLFANIIAGHMVLATVLGLIFIFSNWGVAAVSVAASVALSFLELLVAFIQAYIFTLLTTLYIAGATSSGH
jgi:F-type H+-transporting ATPase subunit a